MQERVQFSDIVRPSNIFCLYPKLYMLRVYLLHPHESTVYHSNTKLDTSSIFSQTGPPQRVDD